MPRNLRIRNLRISALIQSPGFKKSGALKISRRKEETGTLALFDYYGQLCTLYNQRFPALKEKEPNTRNWKKTVNCLTPRLLNFHREEEKKNKKQEQEELVNPNDKIWDKEGFAFLVIVHITEKAENNKKIEGEEEEEEEEE